MDTNSFKVNKVFQDYVKKIEKQSFYGILVGILIFVLFSFFFYERDSMSIRFGVDLFVVTLICGLLIYSSTIRQSNVISNTISEISIVENKFIIQTFEYKIWILSKRKSRIFETERNLVSISESEYPLTDQSNIKKKIILLKLNETSFYIVTEYFDKGLEQKLKQT